MTPKRNTDLVVEQNDGAVIISTNDGVCRAVSVNMVGYAIWRLIDGARDAATIVSELAHTQDWGSQVNRAQLEIDVMEFLANLGEQRVVELKE